MRSCLVVHEVSVTTQIVENVLIESKKHEAKRVTEVHLVIGKLTFLNPEQVRFWYEVLTKGTIMEGSKLRIEETNGLVRCGECGYEGSFKFEDDPMYHVPTPTLCCPECGSIVEITEGRGCLLKRVKLVA